MPPPPTAGSWECIATTPAQMAQVAESLRDGRIGGGEPGHGAAASPSEDVNASPEARGVAGAREADAERAAEKLARIEEEKQAKREAREEEERARNEKRRLLASADRERPSRTGARTT